MRGNEHLQAGSSDLNGVKSTVGALQNARANAVKKLLVEKFGIKASRINAGTGTNTPGGKTNVGTEIKTNVGAEIK